MVGWRDEYGWHEATTMEELQRVMREARDAIFRQNSRLLGLYPSTQTYEGRPCKNCGSTLRYKNGRSCVHCAQEVAREWGRNQRRGGGEESVK